MCSVHPGSSNSSSTDVLGGSLSLSFVLSPSGFCRFLAGHWLDSLGHSILVSHHPPATVATAVLTPLVEHPTAQDRTAVEAQGDGLGWGV